MQKRVASGSAHTTPAGTPRTQPQTIPDESEDARNYALPRRKAWTNLKEKELVEGDTETPWNMATVSHVLRQATARKPPFSVSELRARINDVATILDAQVRDGKASSFDDMVARAITKAQDTLSEQLDKRTEALFDTKFASLGICLDQLQKNVQTATGSIEKATQNFKSTPGLKGHITSFAQATSNLPTYHESIVKRNDLKERQVILDPNPALIAQCQGMSELELVTKANLALQAIDPTLYANDEDSAKFVACRKLANGGVILEASERDVVVHLREEEARNDFMAALGQGFAQVKDSAYSMLLKFVPIEANLHEPNTLREIEDVNGWDTGAFMSARWIKAPERRAQGQRVATMMLRFRDCYTANDAARTGILYHGKRLHPIKPEPEPTRCFKCNRLGSHFARACNSRDVICGTCGKEGHESKACTVQDPNEYRCVNCNTNGHASWNRNCPAFVRAKANVAQRHPESNYRYFPTHDHEWTWEHSTGSLPPARRNEEHVTSLGEGAVFRQAKQKGPPVMGPNPPVGYADRGYVTRDIVQPRTQLMLEQTQAMSSTSTPVETAQTRDHWERLNANGGATTREEEEALRRAEETAGMSQ